jgi:putative oxygen-independent coproporphyrinogen III oxidase
MAELLPADAVPVDDGQVGVYVHLPFCDRICPYCDFAVVAARPLESAIETRYLAALRAELALRHGDFSGRRLASLYFVGGTPSLFSPDAIAELVSSVSDCFEIAAGGIETTLELNPSTVEIERLPGFRAAGIDRLSIGVQSFDDLQLKRLGRAHRGETARETLRAVRRAGFENISVDLIFAGPEQSLEDLERDLDELLSWSPEHVSTYELSYEPETPFGRALAAGKMAPPDEDRSIRMIERIEGRLSVAGLERYEISSYARPGRRARHNARYWQRQAVLGIGMGAHSTEARSSGHPHGARRANPRDLTTWLEQAESGSRPGILESLPVATARGEAVFLALRQKEGLSGRAFEAEFGAPPRTFYGEAIARLVDRGWLFESDPSAGDLRLTAQGRLLADSVAAEFVEPAERV